MRGAASNGRPYRDSLTSKVTMRMPTLLPFGEGCTSGEVIDTRTRSIRRGSGHSTSEGWFVVIGGDPLRVRVAASTSL